MLLKWWQSVTKRKSRVATPGRRRGAVKPGHSRPFLEVLEDRRLPSISGVPNWISGGPQPETGGQTAGLDSRATGEPRGPRGA